MIFQPVAPGSRSPEVNYAQQLFQDLTRFFTEIQVTPIDGLYIGASVQNVQWFQRKLGQAQTGILDEVLMLRLMQLHRLARNCADRMD